MKRTNFNKMILDNIRIECSQMLQQKEVSIQSRLIEDLGITIFDLYKVLLRTFPAESMVPSPESLKKIRCRKKVRLKEFCRVLYKNLVPVETLFFPEPVLETSTSPLDKKMEGTERLSGPKPFRE